MERRTFLGAAAALAALPTDVAAEDSDRDDVTRGSDDPPSSRKYPERTADMGEVRLPEPIDRDGPSLRIKGHHSDTWAEHHVEVWMEIGDRNVWFTLLPDQAREVAADLAAAAEYAAPEDSHE